MAAQVTAPRPARAAQRRGARRIAARSVSKSLKIKVGDTAVSALLLLPHNPSACFVFAHGAGAGMRHPFMASVASELGQLGIATLRYQFPYMERGSRRPDPPKICHATVRAAVATAQRLLAGVALVAGGKSFGARMTSQSQAAEPLAGVLGLAFLGFPLHQAKKPSIVRAEHLSEIKIPLLFIQGSRDALADLALLRPLVKRLGSRANLKLFAGADHSFHVPVRSGKTDAEVSAAAIAALAEWAGKLAKSARQV